MRRKWRDCIVTMIDLGGVKKLAQPGAASSVMRRLHALVASQMETGLPSVASAYVWNDSVLLLSYIDAESRSYEAALRDAEKLKRGIDRLQKSYAVAVKGQTFPPVRDAVPPRVTIIEASSWALANCFEILKKVEPRGQWYVDSHIKSKIQTLKAGKTASVCLFPSGKKRNVHVYEELLWRESPQVSHPPQNRAAAEAPVAGPAKVISKTDRILDLVQEAADRFSVFQARGPGKGNRVTNAAMAYLNSRVEAEIGRKVIQPPLGADTKQPPDFYIQDEATVIEVEFSLRNPHPCLEKDAFKALLAKDAGHAVRILILAGDPGCTKRMAAPAPQAIVAWLRRHHDLEVRIVELRGDHAACQGAGSDVLKQGATER